jgi:hypothetical protein
LTSKLLDVIITHMERSIEELQAALDTATAGFRMGMLGNDTFFAAISGKLQAAGGADLPGFNLEPTFTPNDDGTVRWGVRLTYGRQEAVDELAELGLSFAQYDYFPLADVNLESGDTKLTDEYKGALGVAGVDPLGEESASVLDAWQEGWNGIARGLKGHVGIDPLSGTPGLKAKIEARVSQSELMASPDDQA